MNNVKEVERINEQELKAGIHGGMPGSWHERYKDSAWVYLGGLPFELSEGDILCFMSQWGEIEDINLCRDQATGKSLGFCFLKYENQRSTILAVDNFNGMTLLARVLRCDHVEKYKLPKAVLKREEEILEIDPEADVVLGPGHSYKNKQLANEYTIHNGVDLWARGVEGLKEEDIGLLEEQEIMHKERTKEKKEKKEKKEMKVKKEKKKKRSRSEDRPKGLVEQRRPPAISYTASSDEGAASWRGNREPAQAMSQRYGAVPR